MPPNQTPGTSVDPTTLALSRAIRATEGGDYKNTSGDAGTSKGAYQWQPGHFEAAAKQFGLDPNDFSPANQDHVAYEQIHDQLQKGHSQTEVASWWNSGKYDPTGNVGTKMINGQPVHFDTPAYVAKVQKAYESQNQGGFVDPNQKNDSQSNFVTPPTQQTIPPPETAPTDSSPLAGIEKGAGSLYNSIASPFLGLAALPVQAGIAGINKITGSNIQDPFAQGVPSIAGENTKVSPLDLEKKAGDAAQVGSYFVPGSTGVKGILGAAGTGVLQGAGSAMSSGGDLGTVAGQGAIGGALGGGVAGVTKLAGGALKSIGGALTGENVAKAQQGIKDAYASALNLNASERALENRTGKDLAQVLVDNQAPLGRTESGHLDASKAIPKLQEVLNPLNQKADQLLSHPQGVVHDINLSEVQTEVEKKIDGMTLPEADKIDAKNLVAQYLKAEAQKNGGVLSPLQADKIKQGFWAASFDKNRTNLQNHIPYLLGKTMQEATEKAVAGTDTETSLHLLNQQRGDLIDAIRRLQKMDGVKLLKGGRLGNIASGAIGAIAGAASGTGPLGALAGDYFGTKAAQFLQDPANKIGIAAAKANIAGKIPGLLGKATKPVGQAITNVGKATTKSARVAGLGANLLTK